MTTTTETVTEQTLEQTLNKTDLGHYIYEYRKVFFGFLLVLFVGAIGFILWKQGQASKADSLSAQVFTFSSNELKSLKEGKIEPEAFVAKLKSLNADVKASADMVPVTLEATKFLVEKEKSALALEVTQDVIQFHQSKNIGYLFLAHQLAALAEDQQKFDQAIEVLENLTKAPYKVLEAKTQLDLGRLYLAKGDKEKAKKIFNELNTKFPSDEAAKIAKLYLQDLN